MNVLTCSCGDRLSEFAPLILRVVTGLVFFMHGSQKLMNGVPGVAGFLGTLGFPAPDAFAVILIAVEVIGGALLMLGLWTHWVAKVLAFVALVAILTAHLQKGFFVSGGGYEFALILFAASVSLAITGPGCYSVDRLWKKK